MKYNSANCRPFGHIACGGRAAAPWRSGWGCGGYGGRRRWAAAVVAAAVAGGGRRWRTGGLADRQESLARGRSVEIATRSDYGEDN